MTELLALALTFLTSVGMGVLFNRAGGAPSWAAVVLALFVTAGLFFLYEPFLGPDDPYE